MAVELLNTIKQEEELRPLLEKAFQQVISHGKYILGPEVKQLEEDIQSKFKVKHAVACASGSDALIVALRALGVGEGDEVITTPFTFFATAGAIIHVGAKPVFVDIDSETFNIDPNLIEAAITDKTKAIIPVHLFGQCADMDPILEIAKKHNLKVLEDGAQSIGATYKDQFACTMGDIGTFSFFPSKNLGALGDAGMMITQSSELADKMRILCKHGSAPKYYHKVVGYNSRLDTLQAAFLRVKLSKLDEWSETRRKNADQYRNLMKDLPVTLPHVEKENVSIYNQFVIRSERRDELMEVLKKQQIGCAIYYPLCLHEQECFAHLGYQQGDFPVAEKAAEEVLAIPIYSCLTPQNLEEVSSVIRSFHSA